MSDKPQFDPSQPFQAAKPEFDPSRPFQPAQAEPSLLSKAGTLAKEFFLTGHPEAPGHEAIEPSVGKNLAYPGNLLATSAIQGTKQLVSGNGSSQDMKDAVAGEAKSAPQQLHEAGLPKWASYAAGIPLQVATDPMAGFQAPMFAGALAPVQKGLTNVGQAIADRLKKTATNAAVRHLRPTPGTARALGPEKLGEVGEEALASGAIRPFQKVGDTAERLGDLTDEVGAVKGDLVDESGAMMNGSDVEKAVHERVIGPLESTTAGKRVAGPIRERLDALKTDLGDAPVPASRIEAEKMAEAQDIPWTGASTKARVGADKGYTSALRQSVEDAVESQAGPETLDKFLAAKKSFGNLDAAKDMAERTASLTDGGTGLMGHIADTGAMMEGVQGVATGNPLQAATPVARAITKGRVASTIATGAYGASKAVASGAASLSNPVAKAIAARLAPRSMEQLRTDYLGQQTDPKAQADLKKAQE